MARARNIKPSIMDNEDLAELEPLTRLLFVYLWMLADREGRLEDRPKRIVAQALPYDRNADADKMLSDLAEQGFITRYTANGTACIQINAFAKHQTPHVREAASSLPKQEEAPTKEVPSANLGSDEASPRSLDSLIPDSLIPDSLIGDSGESGDSPPAQQDVPTKKRERKNATALHADFCPDETGVSYADARKISFASELNGFRNYHAAKGSLYKDWQAAWRSWCDKAVEFGRAGTPNARASPQRQNIHEIRANTIAALTGRNHEPTNQQNERDITGEAVRVAG